MSDIVQLAVDAMRRDLGLGPLPEPVGARHVFQTETCEVSVEGAPNGLRAVMAARLGWLSTEARSASVELEQVLRLGLALATVNRAVPGLLHEGADALAGSVSDGMERMTDLALGQGHPVAVAAFADCGPRGAEAAGALVDLSQWAELTGSILAKAPPSAVGSYAAQAPVADPVADMMIIRP